MSKGKRLEQLVSDIEQRLAPEGVDVQLNERIFDEQGIQIAEFDITIRGAVGSSSIDWLIECRDRPSDGACAGAWIEQLVGRRSQFTFDKVFAVSTTGFAPSAIQCAERHGIVLRVVDDITDIATDFLVREFRWTYDDIKIGLPVRFEVVGNGLPQSGESDNLLVKKPNDTIYCDYDSFVLETLEQQGIFGNERPDRVVLVRQIAFQYTEPLDAIIGEKHVRIRDLRAPIEITQYVFVGKLLFAKRYAESGRVIGQEGEFEFPTPEGGKDRCRVQLISRADGGQQIIAHLSANSQFLNGAFELL